jgi:hypothetical protein
MSEQIENNYDIRCGLLMKIELNKNYIENYLQECYNMKFEKKNYNNADNKLINIFWNELNEECCSIFEKPHLYETTNYILEEVKERLIIQSYKYGFNFECEEDEDEDED